MLRKPNNEDFEGKTIKSVNVKSINCWKIYFTDGSKMEIWAENFHYGIPIIEVETEDFQPLDNK